MYVCIWSAPPKTPEAEKKRLLFSPIIILLMPNKDLLILFTFEILILKVLNNFFIMGAFFPQRVAVASKPKFQPGYWKIKILLWCPKPIVFSTYRHTLYFYVYLFGNSTWIDSLQKHLEVSKVFQDVCIQYEIRCDRVRYVLGDSLLRCLCEYVLVSYDNICSKVVHRLFDYNLNTC